MYIIHLHASHQVPHLMPRERVMMIDGVSDANPGNGEPNATAAGNPGTLPHPGSWMNVSVPHLGVDAQRFGFIGSSGAYPLRCDFTSSERRVIVRVMRVDRTQENHSWTAALRTAKNQYPWSKEAVIDKAWRAPLDRADRFCCFRQIFLSSIV